MLSVLFLSALSSAALAKPCVKRFASLPPTVASINVLGNSTSNFPNIYRDGGGGGTISGKQYVIFSDGIYTTGGTPEFGKNWANFSSNSIALSNANGRGPQDFKDWGNDKKGPVQSAPFKYAEGESDSGNGIWPNSNIATLCDGNCGVNFPVVIKRDGASASALYNTGLEIKIGGDGVPVVNRPTKALFNRGEPMYGTFGSVVGIDGYLYTYAAISERKGKDAANGLKLARVPWGDWSKRSSYQYWDGAAWGSKIPAVDDTKSAVLKFNVDCFGESYGITSGDVIWSNYYGAWLLVFASSAPICDSRVYVSFSTKLESGWSKPVPIWEIPSAGSFSYALHAYPNYDASGKSIALSWTQQGPKQDAYYIAWAQVNFA